MPWKETGPMKERINFISDWQREETSISELARKYEISRKTAYKWIRRYGQEGVLGLKERISRADEYPNQTDKKIVEKIIEVKRKHHTWGPEKIICYLENHHPGQTWPAISTAGKWLKKYGYVKTRKKKRRVTEYREVFIGCDQPNDVWSADYKGQIKLRNKKYCYPLTITDNYSGYLLSCDGLYGPKYEETRAVFEKMFREYGLPKAIRTDNGVPFAGTGINGISKLSIWWIKQGIRPERIKKGKPQENGRHERMHRTLKAEAVGSQLIGMKQQQNKLDVFRYDYNIERPHRALGGQTPHSYYERSERMYKENPEEPWYDESYKVRSVRHNGEIKFKGHLIRLSHLLMKEKIALKEIDNDMWEILFYDQTLGKIDGRTMKIIY